MKNRNFPWAIIAAAAVAGAGFAGIANYVRHNQADPVIVKNANDDPNGLSGGTVDQDQLSGNRNTGEKQNGSQTPDKHETDDKQIKVSKVDSLNRAIKNANYSEKGIRVLDVTVEKGNAVIDMNSSVRYNWGSEEEAEFINVLKDALTRFSSIDTFQIRVDGEILKSLSHFEINPVKVR
jgi:Sporulation and spore germination